MGILYLSVIKSTGILQNNDIAGENKAANWKIRFYMGKYDILGNQGIIGQIPSFHGFLN